MILFPQKIGFEFETGEPMLMRLKPVRGGKKWYSNIKHKGRKIEVTLDAYEFEFRKAHKNLGKLLKDLENGFDPVFVKQKLKFLATHYTPTNERNESILKKHILPFFGEYQAREVEQTLVQNYIDQRFGAEPGKKAEASKSTLEKELRVLAGLVRIAIPKWETPSTQYRNISKTPDCALTLEQVSRVAGFVKDSSKEFGDTYLVVFKIITYTGLDVGDVLNLTKENVDLVKREIIKKRGKTGGASQIPISSGLLEVFKTLPQPLNKSQKWISGINSRQVSTAIIRSFRKAGVEGNAKSLRHFVASQLLDKGATRDQVGVWLGHSEGSLMTKVYLHANKKTMHQAFEELELNI